MSKNASNAMAAIAASKANRANQIKGAIEAKAAFDAQVANVISRFNSDIPTIRVIVDGPDNKPIVDGTCPKGQTASFASNHLEPGIYDGTVITGESDIPLNVRITVNADKTADVRIRHMYR